VKVTPRAEFQGCSALMDRPSDKKRVIRKIGEDNHRGVAWLERTGARECFAIRHGDDVVLILLTNREEWEPEVGQILSTLRVRTPPLK